MLYDGYAAAIISLIIIAVIIYIMLYDGYAAIIISTIDNQLININNNRSHYI